MAKKVLSVLTYNIHKGFGVGKVRFVLPKIKTLIQDLDPDFVFLQEVQGRNDRQQKRISDWPEENQTDFIATDIWQHSVYGKNAIYNAGHHGNALLSKYPLIEQDNINVSFLPRASRSLLHGVIELDGTKIHLMCVHLGLFKEERLKQVATLADRISECVPTTEPLILAGDFNDWRKELTDSLETRLGLKEVMKEMNGKHAKSFPAITPTFQTDRIYYRGLSLNTAECFKGKPWRSLSDHLPIYATFSLSN